MSIRYTKINADSYEDGPVLFKKVTTDDVASFVQMTAAELQTELGAIDPNNYDVDTFLFIKDDGSGTNNIVSPQSVAEARSLLGLPSKVYKAYINTTSTTIDPREIENTFLGALTWSRSDVGVLSLVSADSELTDDKTIIHCTMRRTSLATIVVAEDHYETIFRLYNNSGVLTDGLDFFLTIEVYE